MIRIFNSGISFTLANYIMEPNINICEHNVYDTFIIVYSLCIHLKHIITVMFKLQNAMVIFIQLFPNQPFCGKCHHRVSNGFHAHRRTVVMVLLFHKLLCLVRYRHVVCQNLLRHEGTYLPSSRPVNVFFNKVKPTQYGVLPSKSMVIVANPTGNAMLTSLITGRGTPSCHPSAFRLQLAVMYCTTPPFQLPTFPPILYLPLLYHMNRSCPLLSSAITLFLSSI